MSSPDTGQLETGRQSPEDITGQSQTRNITSVHINNELIVVIPSDKLEETNNSSVVQDESSHRCPSNARDSVEKQKITMTSYHHGNYVDLRAGRTLENPVYRPVIESCSGRKHDESEVLKQKYINNEISDLPGKVKNSFHHRRLLKTRSLHHTSGSPDLRSPLQKIRMKPAKTGTSCVSLTPKQAYRCKKLSEFRVPNGVLKKSMDNLLNSDMYPDEVDAEIAALFENYVEECENIAKTKAESRLDGTESHHSVMNGSIHAYLCGFLEEMHRDVRSDETKTDDRSVADDNGEVQCNDLLTDSSHDPETQTQHQRDLISQKQDITHKHLRLWELESSKDDTKNEHENSNSENDSENITDNKGENDIPHTNTPEGACVKSDDKVQDTAKVVKSKEDIPKDATTLHLTKTKRESIEDNEIVKELVERKIFSPYMREKSVNQHKYKTADLSNLTEQDLSIVRLAKQKLEQRLHKSFAMDEAYLNKLKSRRTISETQSRTKVVDRFDIKDSGLTDEWPRLNKVYKKHADDFEAWETSRHHFDDHENIESSEFLHPIDSSEKIYGVPMWTPASSTPLFSPIDSKSPLLKSASDLNGDRESSTGSESAALRDVIKIPKASKYETDFSAEYKKAARLIKLRLTKSSNVVVNDPAYQDKSFTNVPLSPCINYNIENSMRSNVKVTTSINLSETLAQQLREMISNPDKRRHKSIDRSVTQSAKSINQTSSRTTNDTAELPSINGDSIKSKPTGESLNDKNKYIFPDINTPIANEAGHKALAGIPRKVGTITDTGEKCGTEQSDLPSVTVTPLANSSPRASEVCEQKCFATEPRSAYGGVAVRAGVCTSPYKFDKPDPNSLKLKARQLPALHEVCTSCGGISKNPASPRAISRNSSQIWRRKSEFKSKEIHKQCCSSHVDEKWKLDTGHENIEGLPKVAVERLTTQSPELKEPVPVKSITPNMILAPTSRKQNCEEMSIKFMDRNIKFKFQREENPESAGKAESDWLKNISTPVCRDKYECPVMTETRIYKGDFKKTHKVDSRSSVTTPVSSPYLDYCKHRAELRSIRHDIIGRKLTGAFSDTRPAIEKQQEQKVQKIKAFPVLPIKKHKETYSRKSSIRSGQMYIMGKSGREDRSDLFVKPSKPACLPEIKSEIFAHSKENTNNVRVG
ncbi:hypothetical protein ACF0H5_018991 [Mactra antiquata]